MDILFICTVGAITLVICIIGLYLLFHTLDKITKYTKRHYRKLYNIIVVSFGYGVSFLINVFIVLSVIILIILLCYNIGLAVILFNNYIKI